MMKKGFAQIPLMVGLLLMAVAVPVATKLVQTNQDTRNKAAHVCGALGQGCCYTENVGATPIYNTCNSPLKCNAGKCSTTGAPTATKTPTSSTTRPCASNGCSTLGASGSCTYNAYGYTVNGTHTCNKDYINNCLTWSECKAPIGPTAAPPKPCASNGCSTLGASGSCTYNAYGYTVNGTHTCNLNMFSNCLTWSECKAPIGPTAAPTTVKINCMVGSCQTGFYGAPASCVRVFTSVSGTTCPKDNCAACGGGTGIAPTAIPTRVPTTTPTPTPANKCCCPGNGDTCYIARSCRSSDWTMPLASCGSTTPTPTPTTACIRDGNETPTASRCCSGVTHRDPADNALVCGRVVTPTATPTIPCRGLNSTDRCTSLICCSPLKMELVSAGSQFCRCVSNVPTNTPRPTATPTITTPPQTCCSKCPGGTCNGSKSGNMWLQLDDECSAKCICGDVYHKNSNGKYGCGEAKPTEKPTNVPTDPPSNKCTACPTTFACYKNGSEYKWFGKGIAMNGFILTNDADCSSIEKPSYKGKSRGDANCDGSVDVVDYSLWHKEFFDGGKGSTVKSTWYADFTGSDGKCDGKVDTYDFSLWQKYFNELKNI